MSDKGGGRQGGGSSEPNGPNEAARDAARDAGLSREERRELHDRISGRDLTAREVREEAEAIKKGQ
ncbi:hypothetical protein A2368_00960 [Candidatus Collierbacteria bacterium RIFOXYB1_FULL_49_13]|uniref:Uncharacterized protein n=1 Tax=Candidatus Collierbacteria bacterium RIFOXYB1_FULL_49_13 TaxID=1817728 RepID=A0A1F5FHK1_9BACT|nr:MAG: hypothetical protein A2368_00960 [Candidatus Collierbacteria bacterium RIFOXYB1_FULL_49_13]